MYHVYKNGYNTLPNLKKLQINEVFEKNSTDRESIQIEKKEALKNQKYFFEYNTPTEFYAICEKFILDNYPITLKSNNYSDIAKEVEEDFIIHRIENDQDYMSSAHICFPSHWLPEEKIGKSFNEIHHPVPMNLKNSKKLVEAVIYSGIFERFVWSVVYEKKYNNHPRFISKKFDKNNPEVHIKIERQVTVPFPEHHFCLFILRQYLIEEKDIDKQLLSNSIESMNNEQRKYKGLQDCKDLTDYLQKI